VGLPGVGGGIPSTSRSPRLSVTFRSVVPQAPKRVDVSGRDVLPGADHFEQRLQAINGMRGRQRDRPGLLPRRDLPQRSREPQRLPPQKPHQRSGIIHRSGRAQLLAPRRVTLLDAHPACAIGEHRLRLDATDSALHSNSR